jgi:predicted nucleotidyltransferase
LHETLEIASTLIVPLGTQVVLRSDLPGATPSQPILRGTVAEIVRVPTDGSISYGLRCADGAELRAFRQNFSILKQVKNGPIGDAAQIALKDELEKYIIFRCVIGSQAYGLSREGSDVDRRGIYLPPADLEWSLYGVPEQLENRESEECYWELKKFIVLALKANPNILECLWSPIVEQTSEIAEALLAKREIFLSKLVYQTYNGYVMSQFKKLEQDLRVKSERNWKHAMHLIRLLLQGIGVMTERQVGVRVVEHRDALLAIRDGGQTWAEVNEWRLTLHQEFEEAFRRTTLPDAPDYAVANQLLIWARRQSVEVRHES